MILSHRHKLIFLKPRKVAGTSFEIALSEHLGEDDVITPITASDEETRRELGFRGPQNYRYKPTEFLRCFRNASRRELLRSVGRGRMPWKFYNHIPAKACRELVGENTWRQYKKISIVRNPWEFAVSYFYFHAGRNADIGHFTRWCIENRGAFGVNHLQYMIDGEVVIDRFLRYERMESDIAALEREFPALSGLWRTFSGIRAKGGIRPRDSTVENVYVGHPKVDALIEAFCEFEIETFGYQKHGFRSDTLTSA